jgi:hypothetical protein
MAKSVGEDVGIEIFRNLHECFQLRIPEPRVVADVLCVMSVFLDGLHHTIESKSR